MKYRADIDGLRALAVSLVVIYHAFPDAIPSGFIGVDVFFVISGYLITRIIADEMNAGKFSIANFYRRRIQRLFPALNCVLIFTLGVAWLVLYSNELRQLGKHAIAAGTFTANFAFWKEAGYFDNLAETKPLLHLWSLGVEEQFYIVWPALLWLGLRRSGWLIGLSALSFGVSLWLTRTSPDAAFFLPHARFWELSIGALLALYPRLSEFGERYRQAAGVGGLACILVAATFTPKASFPGLWASLPTVGTALIIASRTSFVGGFLSRQAMTSVGKISYPLYLWHWPLLSFAFILEAGNPSPLVRGVCVAVSIALAFASYRWLERPFRAPTSKRPPLYILTAPMVACVAIGSLIVVADGFPHRLGYKDQLALSAGEWAFPGNMSRASADGVEYFETSPAAPRAVLFIGDSTVSQYGPRAEAVASPNVSAIFFTRYGCLAINGAFIDTAPQCRDYMRESLAFALAEKRIKTVVLGSQWYGAINDAGSWVIETAAGPKSIELQGPGYEAALASIGETIGTLRRSGKNVVLLLSTPFGDQLDPRNVVSRKFEDLPTFFFADRLPPSGIDRTAFEEDHTVLRSDLAEVARQNGADVLDPLNALCQSDICSATAGEGVPIYMDRSHLHPDFVRDHVTFLDEILRGS